MPIANKYKVRIEFYGTLLLIHKHHHFCKILNRGMSDVICIGSANIPCVVPCIYNIIIHVYFYPEGQHAVMVSDISHIFLRRS